MAWTVSMHRDAIGNLYRIPRGEAAYVTEALRALQVTPYRPDAELVAPDMYRITVRGHVIEFSVIGQEVKILNIQ